MKTRLSLLITILAFLIINLVSRATPISPVRLEYIPPAVTMTMDGYDCEPEYSALMNTTVFNAFGLTGGDADFNADIKLAWDYTFLYLFALINDDVEENYTWAYSSPWTFDNVEVFLQLDTNTVITIYDEHTIQLRICRGLDSVEKAGRAERTDYIYYAGNTGSTGWVAEVAIPWTAVLAAGEGPELPDEYVNTHIGFEFEAGDSDNTDGDPTVGNRDCNISWDPDDDDNCFHIPCDDDWRFETWNNTSLFGRIVLLPDKTWAASSIPNRCTNSLTSQDEEGLSVFPNPANNALRVKSLRPGSTIEIFNMHGIKVVSAKQADVETEIDISSLHSGLYTAVINNKEAVRFVKE